MESNAAVDKPLARRRSFLQPWSLNALHVISRAPPSSPSCLPVFFFLSHWPSVVLQYLEANGCGVSSDCCSESSPHLTWLPPQTVCDCLKQKALSVSSRPGGCYTKTNSRFMWILRWGKQICGQTEFRR